MTFVVNTSDNVNCQGEERFREGGETNKVLSLQLSAWRIHQDLLQPGSSEVCQGNGLWKKDLSLSPPPKMRYLESNISFVLYNVPLSMSRTAIVY